MEKALKKLLNTHGLLISYVVAGVVVLIYAIVRFGTMISPAVVPDELLFLKTATAMTTTNAYGYGVLYWLFYGLLTKIPSDPITLAQVTSWLASLVPPIVILFLGIQRKTPYTLFAVLLWLVMPVAWWYGKITGPDLYVLALTALGIAAAVQWDKSIWIRIGGAALIGSAIGIRTTSLPLIVFLLLIIWFKDAQRFRGIASALGGLITGFVIANPILLTQPTTYIETFNKFRNVAPPDYSWSHLVEILFANTFTWDLIYVGGFFRVGIHWLVIILLTGFIVYKRESRHHFIATSITLLFAVALFFTSGAYYGWYWFPLLFLLPYIMLTNTRVSMPMYYFASAIVVVAFVTAFPQMYYDMNQHRWHASVVTEAQAVQPCVEDVLKNASPDMIIDYSEYGLDTNYLAQFGEVTDKNGAVSYSYIDGGAKEYVPQNYVLIIGERIGAEIDEHHIESSIVPLYSDPMNLEHIETCGPLDVYTIKPKK